MRKQDKVVLLVSNTNIEYLFKNWILDSLPAFSLLRMKRVCFFAKSKSSTKICVHILCLKIRSPMLIKSPFNFTVN